MAIQSRISCQTYAVALVQFLYIRSVSLDWTAISTSGTEPEPSPRQSMHLRISCAALWSCLALVLPLMITVAWIRGFHQYRLLPSTKRWPTKRWVNVHSGWPSQYWSHLGSLARPPLCQKAANCPVTVPARTVPWFLGIPNPLVDAGRWPWTQNKPNIIPRYRYHVAANVSQGIFLVTNLQPVLVSNKKSLETHSFKWRNTEGRNRALSKCTMVNLDLQSGIKAMDGNPAGLIVAIPESYTPEV